MKQLRVSSKSNSASVAGAIVAVVREEGGVELQTIGAGALNQAVKAVAIARWFEEPGGMELICIPEFTMVDIDGEEWTAIKMVVKAKESERMEETNEKTNDSGCIDHSADQVGLQ